MESRPLGGLGGNFLGAQCHSDIGIGSEGALQIYDLFEDPAGPRLLLEVPDASE
jgi:hypothetical protein